MTPGYGVTQTLVPGGRIARATREETQTVAYQEQPAHQERGVRCAPRPAQ